MNPSLGLHELAWRLELHGETALLHLQKHSFEQAQREAGARILWEDEGKFRFAPAHYFTAAEALGGLRRLWLVELGRFERQRLG